MPAKIEVKDLITTRLKLSEVAPNLVAEYGEDTEFIRKGIIPTDLDIKDNERSIISYITTGAVDRDGEIILPSGGDLRQYRKNPVVLFCHQYSNLPIGKNLWIKSDLKGLIAKTQYATHDEAEKIYQYRKDGFPLAESIGFIPTESFHRQYQNGKMAWLPETLELLKTKYGLDPKTVAKARGVYTKWILLEYSDVSVPSNHEAIQIAIGKGLIAGEKDIEGTGSNSPIGVLTESQLNEPHSKNCDCMDCLEKNVCQKDVEGVECTCDECKPADDGGYLIPGESKSAEAAYATGLGVIKSTMSDYVVEFKSLIKSGVPAKESLESLEKMSDYMAEVRGLVEAGLTVKEALDALEKIESILNKNKEIEPETIADPESFYFDMSESNGDLISYDEEAIKEGIESTIKAALSDVREDLLQGVSKCTKDEINRLKGVVIDD
jgi:hypothetical protein